MEERVSGFVVTGSWGEVVEHGERVSAALEACGVEEDNEDFQEWEEWRPKAEERLGNDISEKTAEKASVDEGAGEQQGKTPNDDIQAAGERANESLGELRKGRTKDSAETWQQAVLYAARAADSAARKALRGFEEWLYRNLMTAVSPYYFDNTLVSANISKKSGIDAPAEYTFEVNIVDDELKAAVGDHLRGYEEGVDRWHMETKKDTEIAEVVEGADVPETAKEYSSRQMGEDIVDEDAEADDAATGEDDETGSAEGA